MTNESRNQAGKPVSTPESTELEAQDFFPPGTGWNHAKKPDNASLKKDVPRDAASWQQR